MFLMILGRALSAPLWDIPASAATGASTTVSISFRVRQCDCVHVLSMARLAVRIVWSTHNRLLPSDKSDAHPYIPLHSPCHGHCSSHLGSGRYQCHKGLQRSGNAAALLEPDWQIRRMDYYHLQQRECGISA